ncbi:hypothetical protein [Arthrobacter sp. G119Y2]|uniref:hypothetical protein n=1 Tax=Arthrobacter sp. G119Y2 TaxID=3134965 RepID=UPI003119FB2E
MKTTPATISHATTTGKLMSPMVTGKPAAETKSSALLKPWGNPNHKRLAVPLEETWAAVPLHTETAEDALRGAQTRAFRLFGDALI